MKENDGGKSVGAQPEMKIARMIDDGGERCFVSWWLGVRKNGEHHTGIKGNGCHVPCDYIPRKSYPLFRANEVLRLLIGEVTEGSEASEQAGA